MDKKLKDYDMNSLMELYDTIKLPSEEEIPNNRESVSFELYKKGKQVMREIRKLKEENLEILMKKFNSDPYDDCVFNKKLIKILEENSKLALEVLISMKKLLNLKDHIVFRVINDSGYNVKDLSDMIIFYETCLDIVEKDKEKWKKKGW